MDSQQEMDDGKSGRTTSTPPPTAMAGKLTEWDTKKGADRVACPLGS